MKLADQLSFHFGFPKFFTNVLHQCFECMDASTLPWSACVHFQQCPLLAPSVCSSQMVWEYGYVCEGVCVWRGCLCAFLAMSTFSPFGLRCANGTRMCVCVCVRAWVCLCVCAYTCVHMRGINLKCAQRWHIHILIYFILCQCYTQAHACTHPQTIWGQRTDRAKSGYCHIFMQCRCCQLRFLKNSFSVTLFCLAAVVFPIGFHIAAIGGRPYKLPHHTQVGSAYVLFIMAIFFTVISELFSSRVCLPVLWWCSISVCCKAPQSSSLHCHCHLRTVVLSSVCQFCDGVPLVFFSFYLGRGVGGGLFWCFLLPESTGPFFFHTHLGTILQSARLPVCYTSHERQTCDGVLWVFTADKHSTIFFTIVSELFSSHVCLLVASTVMFH